MFGRRNDGKQDKNIDPIIRMTSVIMPKRYDAMVNYLCEARCEAMDEFISKKEEEGIKISYMHVVIAGLVRMYAERPSLNRFVMNTRIYNRDGIYISLTVKKALRDGAGETTIKVRFDGTENIYQIKEKMDAEIYKNKGENAENGTDKASKFLIAIPSGILKFTMAVLRFMDRHGMIPKKLIEISPFHTSCFITNMKSISTEYVYHHIYDFGTCSLFIGLGKEKIEPVANADNTGVELGKVIRLGTVIDERICDGLYNAKSIKLVKKYIQNPHLLEENYVYPPKELTSKEKKKQAKAEKKLAKKQAK